VASEVKGEVQVLNEDVYNLKEEVERLQEKSEQCERRVASIVWTTIMPTRTVVLDDWSGHKSKEAEGSLARLNNSFRAHRGDVLEDYYLIKRMSRVNPGRADDWKCGFERQYGITYASCREMDLECAPNHIHEHLNIAADVRSIETLERGEERKSVLDKSSKVIHQWVREEEGVEDNYQFYDRYQVDYDSTA
jgi:hypothetical protein